MSKGYLGLPQIGREDFNRLSRLYYPGDDLRWAVDNTNPGVIDPNEIAVADRKAKLADFACGSGFTALFNARYQQIVELRRQELVRAEVAKTQYVPMVTDFSRERLPADEREMIKHILRAGQIIEDLYQMQLGSRDFRGQLLESGTAADAALMGRYQQPWCESNEDPLCNGLATFTPEVNPMEPDGLSQEEAGKENPDLVAPFTVVQQGGETAYEAVPYARSFLAPKMREVAAELRTAAGFAVKINERSLAAYMTAVASALESDRPYPYVDSDDAWLRMKGHSKYYLRIGADETQWDAWQKKAGFGMTFGRIDVAAAKSVEGYRPLRQRLEEAFADVIGAPYKARRVAIELPDFINVVMENGDARGSVNGTPAAQTLPNWCGEDGTEECHSRTMLFQNKNAKSYSPEVLEKYGLLLDPANMANLRAEALNGGMVDHEFAHNLGPRQNLPAEDGQALEKHIGDYAMKLEELKAQTGALFFNGLLGKWGERSAAEAKAGYTAEVLWMFGHLRRGLPRYKQGKFHESPSPYQQLSAVQLGYLQEKGAISFDAAAQRFTIHYEKMHDAVKSLLHDIGQVYLRHDPKEVVAFFERYTKGDGLASLQMPAIDKAIGSLPGNLYDWEVRGIEG